MKIDREIAEHLVQLKSSYLPFQRSDGSIIVRLNKALYGTM
jgi:hypothetical protein